MQSESVSLHEFTKQIQGVVRSNFAQTVWIRAEINQISVNRSGHCYLELIEKHEKQDQIIASIRATIWASAFRGIHSLFLSQTGESLKTGIKILAKVIVDYHEVYGISLNIRDIDPTFTIGDQAQKRKQILMRLEETGVMNLNKELELERVPQKLAIISSQTAAGYEDFLDHLINNQYHVNYYTALFPAVMQGNTTSASIIQALDRIAHFEEYFDAVILIRGGGSKTDLSYFDDFDLAFNLAQFPIPVITGIGHERDETITDLVAHTTCKTPTAVAHFILELAGEFISELDWMNEHILDAARQQLSHARHELHRLSTACQMNTGNYLIQEKHQLKEMALISQNLSKQLLQLNHKKLSKSAAAIRNSTIQSLREEQVRLNNSSMIVKHLPKQALERHRHQLHRLEQMADYANPLNILKRGYSVTVYKGKVIKDSQDVPSGEIMTTKLHKGAIKSKKLK